MFLIIVRSKINAAVIVVLPLLLLLLVLLLNQLLLLLLLLLLSSRYPHLLFLLLLLLFFQDPNECLLSEDDVSDTVDEMMETIAHQAAERLQPQRIFFPQACFLNSLRVIHLFYFITHRLFTSHRRPKISTLDLVL